MYKALIRPLLFCFDPERVHYFSLWSLELLLKIPLVRSITQKTFTNFMNIRGFEIKYINNNIHALLKPKDTNTNVENNLENTLNILNNLKIKKKFIYPLKLVYHKLRNHAKKMIR